MTLEIAPTYSCPVGCVYCYHTESWLEHPNELRAIDYDIDKMIDGWLKRSKELKNKEAIFHGGEPLLMSINDMDEFCRRLKDAGCEKFGIQTSTYGMSKERIELFKKYHFSVGVSFDGGWYWGCPKCFEKFPDTDEVKNGVEMECPSCGEKVVPFEFSLNKGRSWINNPKKQEMFSHETEYWIKKMQREGIPVGVICVLNKFNSGNDILLGGLMAQFERLSFLSVRFNPVHEEQPALKELLELSEERVTQVYLTIAKRQFENNLNWYPFEEYKKKLTGIENLECWSSGCDPTHTTASSFVNGNGQITLCPKLSTFYNNAVQVGNNKPSKWRTQLLRETPFENGGCKGCKFLWVCAGGCESDGIDGDIRNRSRFCNQMYQLYDYVEKEVTKGKDVIPFSELPEEKQMEIYNKIRGASKYSEISKVKEFVWMD
jgi:uncharacterized protein